MNNSILTLIKDAVNSEKDNNIEAIYRKIWLSVLEQFRLNAKNEIVLLLNEKNNEYYNLLYYTGKSIVETQFKMTKLEKDFLFKMLLDDGFKIKDTTISINCEKIVDYANGRKKDIAVPSEHINMIDEFKIKRHK